MTTWFIAAAAGRIHVAAEVIRCVRQSGCALCL